MDPKIHLEPWNYSSLSNFLKIYMDSLTYSFCLVKYEYILFSFLPGFILGVFHKSASFPFLAPNIDKTKPYSCIDKTKPNSCILFVCDILSNILDCFFHCPNIKMYCGYCYPQIWSLWWCHDDWKSSSLPRTLSWEKLQLSSSRIHTLKHVCRLLIYSPAGMPVSRSLP